LRFRVTLGGGLFQVTTAQGISRLQGDFNNRRGAPGQSYGDEQ
jgi:hypothetical protein